MMRRSELAIAVIVMACLAIVATTSARAGVANKIVFVQTYSNDWGREEVWTMNTDGSGRSLVTNQTRPYYPSIAPDGILLVSVEKSCPSGTNGTGCRIVLRFPGGKAIVPLEKLPRQMEGVTSPDGQSVAVDALDERATHYIYLVRSGITTLFAQGASPTWSPNGSRIAFTRDGIVVRDMSGNETTLTNGRHYNPSWSPDGSRIAFSYVGDGKPQTTDILVIPAGGGNPVTIVSGMVAFSPSWLHPSVVIFQGAKLQWDGDRVVTGWNWDIWAVDLGSGQVHPITNTPLEGEMWANSGN